MVKYTMHITAQHSTDPVARMIGLSIDDSLTSEFYKTNPETIVTSAYRYYDADKIVDLPIGKHKLYILVNSPEQYKWNIEIYIKEIVSGTHFTYSDSPLAFDFNVPEVPPITGIEEAITSVEEAIAALEEGKELTAKLAVTVAPEVTITEGIVTPKVTTMPNLPWYVAWLQPVLDFMGMLTESAINYLAPIFAPIKDGVTAIIDFPKNLISGAVTSAGDALGSLFHKSIESTIENVTEIGKGTPEWYKDLDAGLKPLVDNIVKGYSTALDVKTYEKSPLTGVQAVAALEDLKGKLIATALANFSLHVAIETSSLGQIEAFSQIEPMVVSKYGLDEVVRAATMLPIEKAILKPAEQEINSRYTPEIPAYTDLITMVVKEVISLDDFKVTMTKLGFNANWSQRIWDAHFFPPNYSQILTAYFRGTITKDKMESLRTLVDLDPRFKDIWDANIEVIPDVSELTNELVKEVIDLPTYQKYLQWHGFGSTWAKRIWDAHFYPPTLGDILTAWRRGKISEADVDKLMILVDLDPRFKEIFDTRKYVDPSLSLTRFMYETGAIGADEVSTYVHRQGYSPEHEKAITDYLVRFQERLWRRRYLVSLSTAASLGAVDAKTLTSEVIAAGYSEGVAEWMLKTSDMRMKIESFKVEHPKPKLMTIGNLKDAYLLDKIDADKLRIELLQRGYLLDEVDLLIDLMDEDKIVAKEGKRVIALSIPQLLDSYRYGNMTRDALMIKLQTRGLALDETEMLISTKEKQWGMVS
jgi:hypothetical protein